MVSGDLGGEGGGAGGGGLKAVAVAVGGEEISRERERVMAKLQRLAAVVVCKSIHGPSPKPDRPQGFILPDDQTYRISDAILWDPVKCP